MLLDNIDLHDVYSALIGTAVRPDVGNDNGNVVSSMQNLDTECESPTLSSLTKW